jgi:hypothetical protein
MTNQEREIRQLLANVKSSGQYSSVRRIDVADCWGSAQIEFLLEELRKERDLRKQYGQELFDLKEKKSQQSQAWSARVQGAENRLRRAEELLEAASVFDYGKHQAIKDGARAWCCYTVQEDGEPGREAYFDCREYAIEEALYRKSQDEDTNKEEGYETSRESNDGFHSSSLDSEEI